MHRQTSFGPLLWLAWSLTLLLALALAAALLETQRFLRHRFRRRYNRQLLAAGLLLLAGVAVTVLFTVWTQAGMTDTRTLLDRPLPGRLIPDAGRHTASYLAGTGFRAAAAVWILIGGALLMALAETGLRRHRRLPVQAPVSAHPGGPVTAAPAPRSRRSRRAVRTVTVVASCLAVLAAVAVMGVRALGHEPAVTLLANWTGDDERHFREAVIEPFRRKYHIRVDYQGSNAESQVLGADVEAGTPPDVVVLTGPGELAEYARQRHLVPLGDLVRHAEFGPSWATRLTDGHVYWFPLKADLKSIVWYPSGLGERELRQAVRRPAAWCLGMGSGATSGWPGTDWIEDILLQRHGPAVYERWAGGDLSWRSPQVRSAWTAWRDLVGAGADQDLVRRALQTPYQSASDPVAARPRGCTLEHQASFIRGRPAWRQTDGRYISSAELLHGAAPRGWEVSGDLVALLHDTPQARKLIRYLASADAQRAWNEGSPASPCTPVCRPPPTAPAPPGTAPSPSSCATGRRRTASTPPMPCRPRCVTRSPRRPSNSSPTPTAWTACSAPWTPSAAPRA